MLARGLKPDSWLSRRVQEYGAGPCAFVLTGAGGLSGARASKWFGNAVFWADEKRL